MECTVAWYNAARASSAQDSLWTAVKQKKSEVGMQSYSYVLFVC
jgi:hypothetical protein